MLRTFDVRRLVSEKGYILIDNTYKSWDEKIKISLKRHNIDTDEIKSVT